MAEEKATSGSTTSGHRTNLCLRQHDRIQYLLQTLPHCMFVGQTQCYACCHGFTTEKPMLLQSVYGCLTSKPKQQPYNVMCMSTNYALIKTSQS